jgi:lipoprotein-anchoring transpeptidase ErfK/SrfK
MHRLTGRQLWTKGSLLCFAWLVGCSQEAQLAASSAVSEVVEVAERAKAARAPQAPPAVQPHPAPPAKPTISPTPAAARLGLPARGFGVKNILGVHRILEPGEFLWEPEGAPAGPVRIVIDLRAQHLYVYRGGVEIGRSFVLYGADNKPTPTGTFAILQKKVDHHSRTYDAPMPFMLRLTNDGVAIHASEVIDGESATHGCIGLPREFASLLFKEAKIGDKVLVTNRWMWDVYYAPLRKDAPQMAQATA